MTDKSEDFGEAPYEGMYDKTDRMEGVMISRKIKRKNGIIQFFWKI